MSERERFCPVCGESLGILKWIDPHETCGKRECEREMRYAADQERADAHEQLDDELGYRRL